MTPKRARDMNLCVEWGHVELREPNAKGVSTFIVEKAAREMSEESTQTPQSASTCIRNVAPQGQLR